MPLDVLLGLQWGDEGKGKVVDYLAPRYKCVARYQGGPNAGHTLVHNGVKHVLHQVPSGIFHQDIINIIGNGVVLDAVVFGKEIAALEARGLAPTQNLIISKKAQLIIPTHRLLDRASEASKGASKIGSTLKGIGPAYQDKYARNGLRVADLLRQDFEAAYAVLRDSHLAMIAHLGGTAEDLSNMEAEFFAALDGLRRFRFDDTEYLLNDMLADGDPILAEGAQGALLDIDFGSYPFVTSSSTMTAGACSGLGVAPRHVRDVFGVFKAYCTRVGSGPFPTELHDAKGESLRQKGQEFGSTTGRPRRTGWLDLPALRYAAMLSGCTHLLMMKADVLSAQGAIEVCTGYELNGIQTERYPSGPEAANAHALYHTLDGWLHELEGHELSHALSKYVAYIEHATGIPIPLVSLGPDRTQTLLRGAWA